MYATGSKPVRVSAFPVQYEWPTDCNRASYVNEKAAIVTCLNDDRSVFRVTGCSGFGGHENSYRICGDKGQIENIRGSDGKLVVHYNAWEKPEGEPEVKFYYPELHDKDAELIVKQGHGGGDFFVIRKFFDCIRNDIKPEMDVYFATRLASVAILSHRSLLEKGVPYDIPDLSLEKDRKKYESDNLSPFWYSDGRAPTIRPCLDENYSPSEQQIENLKIVLNK
jgi:hypothetical protein